MNAREPRILSSNPPVIGESALLRKRSFAHDFGLAIVSFSRAWCSMNRSRVAEVHDVVRVWLRDGGRRPGEALVVKDLATALRLSATPVREALEQLVGRGLVAPSRDRTGFEIPRFGPRDLAGLYDLHQLMGEGALVRAGGRVDLSDLGTDTKTIRGATEFLFGRLFESAGSTFARAGSRLADHLATFRLVEPAEVGNGSEEVEQLARALTEGRARQVLRAYHRRRITKAASIVEARDALPQFEPVIAARNTRQI